MDVKKIRHSLGLSQDKFAAVLLVAPQTVRRWEKLFKDTGECNPSPLKMAKLVGLEQKTKGEERE